VDIFSKNFSAQKNTKMAFKTKKVSTLCGLEFQPELCASTCQVFMSCIRQVAKPNTPRFKHLCLLRKKSLNLPSPIIKKNAFEAELEEFRWKQTN